jgi:hypothetical protein
MAIRPAYFLNLKYLQQGNERQRNAYRIIQQLELWETLRPYNPVLAGTIPIEIDIPESDLDILCCVNDFDSFSTIIETRYVHLEDYTLENGLIRGTSFLAISFKFHSVPIEIFAQNKPTDEQDAFRHLLIEDHLLQENGKEFMQSVIDLKRNGIKTEPAFARLIGMKGDPYLELLKLEELYRLD